MQISLEEYDRALSETKKAIKEGKIVVYPTDTLYGLGCNALDKEAVERIYKLKGREGKKPLSVIVSDFGMLKEYCEVSGEQMAVLFEALPGPYTFLLKAKKKIPAGVGEKLGVRVPEHFFMRTVAKQLGFPIVSTSANLSGGKGPTELKEVPLQIRKAAALIIDGGRTTYAQPSTVIDLVERKIVRKGASREGVQLEGKFSE